MANAGRKMKRARARKKEQFQRGAERRNNQFTPEQMRRILAEGNPPGLCEFVGVKCLHYLGGSVMSFETLTLHRLEGCQPLRVADNIRELTRARDSREDADGSQH